MKWLILILLSCPAHGVELAPAHLSIEDSIKWYEARDDERRNKRQWAKAESRRVLIKYPQLAPVYESHPYKFQHLLRIIKEEGKTFEDVIGIEPAQRPPQFKQLLGDRV